MNWSSKNVQQGGILHSTKVAYRPETQQFLKVLMEENHLSMMQRKKLNYTLRNGEPLPSHNTSNQKSKLPPVTIRPGSSKRRSKATILSSGAYEIEKYQPINPGTDRNREIEKLANKMAYNKDIIVTTPKIIKKIEPISSEIIEQNRLDQLLKEIEERKIWLNEMEELGEGHKYRTIIEQQIHNKTKEMDLLRCEMNKKLPN